MEGATLTEVIQENPYQYCLHSRGLEKLLEFTARASTPSFREVTVVCLVGDTGCGKTRAAYEYDGGLYKLDRASSTGVWFDGYSAHRTLLLDDFYGWIPYGQLLNLLDGYIIRLDVKGGFTYGKYDTVIITSNKHPDEWFRRSQPDGVSPALARRITRFMDLRGVSYPPEYQQLAAWIRGERPDLSDPLVRGPDRMAFVHWSALGK